eukprot:CAMPEP_0194320456 /NCGR_PEP_ID=MMETSP0171-20130528/16786_1 /TAXON_ID=218684 /ORGANISM="Corethron pennatum, Strain L29A3" /LENGTH=298 /DNA_ID=CAMNT_0039077997 /DNA_START=185 /DNA_END=1081 /DNA_ORIENTATION=+
MASSSSSSNSPIRLRKSSVEGIDGYELVLPNAAPRSNIYYDAFYATASDKMDGEFTKDVIVYLPGLTRTTTSAKATSLASFCDKNGFTFISADYYGVARADPTKEFLKASISRWVEDYIYLLERTNPGKRAVLVGAGVGGWISTILAMKRPDLVRGIVGISADPDFTEDLIWNSLSKADQDGIMSEGFRNIKWGDTVYPITKTLIEDGRKNLILRNGSKSIDIDCPVRLIHAMYDIEVPYSTPFRLADVIKGRDVSVTIIKGADHMLAREEDTKKMHHAVKEVLENAWEYDLTSPASG